jgi:hypothetical protein
MIYLIEFILVLPVNLAIAWWHSRLIKAGRPIRHGAWSVLYAALIAIAIWVCWTELPHVGQMSVFALACACGRLAIFAPALNLFRGLSLTYVSKTSTSIIDRIEVRLFGVRAWLVEIGAAILFIILQFFL